MPFSQEFREEESQMMTLDEFVLENKKAMYLLKIRGDHLKDCGIFHGDFCLVERTCEAKKGDLVMGAENGVYITTFWPTDKKIMVEGVIRSLIRKYEKKK